MPETPGGCSGSRKAKTRRDGLWPNYDIPVLKGCTLGMKARLLVYCALAILPGAAVTCAQASGSTEQERAAVNQYCVVCHNLKAKAAGMEPARKLTLDNLDIAHVEKDPEVWETVVRKLRAGMMPPSGMPRPKPADFEGIIAWLEHELDRH